MSLDIPRALQDLRLAQLPKVTRVVITLFVLLAGAGYLVALLNLYLTYSMIDGHPGVTPDDLKRSFYGKRDNTMLASKIDGGSMAQYLTDPQDRGRILSWIQDGATEAKFATVQPIFQRNCVRCHNPSGISSFRPLTRYEEVATVTKVDRGEPLPTWARVAHVHLQSLALVYLALGLLFSLCGVSEKLKLTVVSTPFVAVAADFGARALAHFWPSMVYVVMLAGALMGLSTAGMILGVLYEMWLWKPRPMPAPAAPRRS